jgi:hypothetical protein
VADLPTQSDFQDFEAWAGRDVLAPDGDRLGAVDLIFLDEATGAPEWVLVSLDEGAAFVPLAGATVEERSIRVGQDAERVQAAPRPDAGETLSVADEKRLYEHYGLEYSQAESSTVLPEGTTSEEERPRLKKYVGAPVPAPAEEEPTADTASEDPADAPTSPAQEASAPSADDAAAGPPSAGEPEGQPSPAESMAPRNLSDATPSPLPPRKPDVLPPAGGNPVPESKSSKLRTAIPIALGSAIAGLIAVLAWRRRR